MLLSILVGALIGFVGSTGYWLAVALVVVYGSVQNLDRNIMAVAPGIGKPSTQH